MSDLSQQLCELDDARQEVRKLIDTNADHKWYINQPQRTALERAFALYYLSGSLLDPSTFADASVLLQDELKRHQRAIEAHGERCQKNADISVLPNSYASAVLAAGYLKGLRSANDSARLQRNSAAGDTHSGDKHCRETGGPPKEVEQAVKVVIDWLTKQINSEGYIPSLNQSKGQKPSSYLTFWCAAALTEWQEYSKDRNIPDQKDSLERLAAWSGRRLRDMLAFHHAQLQPQFDIIETVYASTTLLLASTDSDDGVLVKHALEVLFGSYFKGGCLEGSAPVFTDVTTLIVQISTAEALATIFLVDSAAFLAAHRPFIESACKWLRDHGNVVDGWYPEGQGRPNTANAYITAAAMRLLAEYARMLDGCLDRDVWTALGLRPFVPNPDLEKIKYPGDLACLDTRDCHRSD
jgi:hypothetical protein